MLRCLICLTVALAATAPQGTGSISSDSVRQADQALARGDAAQALTLLDQALRANPDDSGALLLLGRAYLAMMRPADAVPALRRAADLLQGPPRQEALEVLAAALARSERTAEATGILEEMLKAAPARPATWHDLGMIDLSQGRLSSARSRFEKELELLAQVPPDVTARAGALEGLGIAACRLGDDPTALKAFGALRALPAVTPSLDGRYHEGLTLLRAGRAEEAAVIFRAILKQDPEHRGALQNLSRAAAALGKTQERDEALARFSALYSQDEAARTARVKVADLREQARKMADAHDLIGAAEALKQAIDLAPADVALRIEYGRALQSSGERAGAAAAFREAIARDPMSAEAHFRLGRLLVDESDVPGALAAFERATQLQPLRVAYHVSLAQTYLRLQRTDDGVRELRLAQRLAPDDPESSFNLGLGLAQAGSLQEAAAELETAVARGYRDPIVHSVLAQVYQAMGDTARSQAAMERFRKLTQPQEPPK